MSASTTGKAPSGIELLIDLVSSSLVDASAVSLGNLLLLLSKLIVPYRGRPAGGSSRRRKRAGVGGLNADDGSYDDSRGVIRWGTEIF